MKKLTKKANEMNLKELAAYIDYSVLKPEFTEKEIVELTKDGVKLECATICINHELSKLKQLRNMIRLRKST